MRTLRYILIMIVIALLAVPVSAATWYVHPGGFGDATTLQDGVNLAADGDVVLVAAGTYTGAGNVNVLVDSKSITVVSESGANATIIDCQSGGRGFLFTNADGSILEGFTIKNGAEAQGGAIHLDDTDVTVRYNILTGNVALLSGGAIYMRKSAPVVHNNTIDGNSAPVGGGIALKGPITGQVYQNVICSSPQGGGITCTTGPLNTVVSCNDVFGNAGGDAICAVDGGSNFASDPLFCPGSGNYYVQQTSPCSAAWSPCGLPVGALGVLCTPTATETATWGKVKSLYR